MDSSGELLLESCKVMGILLTQKQQDCFFKYQKLLLSWNEKINLTTIIEPNAVALRHFADSLSISTVGFDFSAKASLIDIGTGAGFPGIPLKIVYPNLEVTLLDSLQKRISFLDAVISELSLSEIEAVHSRAEDGGQNPKFREQFDIAVSRALAPMSVLLEYALPYVKVGGVFLSMKGPSIESEMSEAQTALELLGGELISIQPVTIPLSDLQHNLVMIRKIVQTPIRFPRKANKIGKTPIK